MNLPCSNCGKPMENSGYGFMAHVDTGVNYCGPKRTFAKAWQPIPIEFQSDAADLRDAYDPQDDRLDRKK